MNVNPSNQPLTHWSQLLTLFLLPGILQGIAFYTVLDSTRSILLGWQLFAVWFLVIAPTCVFLISVPQDRWRSVGVAVVLAALLSGLLFFDAKDGLGTPPDLIRPGSLIAVGIICSMIVIFSVLPFYRTRWQRGRSFGDYPSLFEFAWNQTVCVLVGLAFIGLVAALVALTVALFNTIGIELNKWLFDTALLGAWVGGAFATAIGITRQSDTVVLGTRVLLLALLRILLPVMLPICIVFVVLVSVVGVEKVDTGLSIALLMVAVAVTAIILISSRIGNADEKLSGFQQILTRGMAFMVLPLALLAVHALWFRVEQHGWTGHRVLAGVAVSLCVIYGVGYLLAAVRSPLVWIPVVNRWMAGVCATIALLLMTPLLDPDRIGVRDQMARFYDGRTSAEQLDLGYLKFQSGRVGRSALQALSARPESDVPPLNSRLEQLASVNDPYSLDAENMSIERQGPIAKAIDAGTFRLLEEDSSGWVRWSEFSQTSQPLESQLLDWGQYEISEFCLTQAKDCAYLTSSSDADLLAIRLSETQMSFYLLPIDQNSKQLPENLDAEQLSEAVASEQSTPNLPPIFPQSPEQFNSEFNGADIDDWFASLDEGRVPTEIVQVPSFAIGPFRLLKSGSLLQ